MKREKKIAILGNGTAGCVSASMIKNSFPNAEISLYYSPNKPAQSVGEGSALSFPRMIKSHLQWDYSEIKELEFTSKIGILKKNWGNSEEFLHPFPVGSSGLHFNANKFQQKVVDYLSSQINIEEKHINSHSELDFDHIIDCSGTPSDFTKFQEIDDIPVNAAHIVQCYWDKPEFDYSLTIARPYGWVFGIPLQNRCSIGYLYNKNINTLDEVKEDIKEIFNEYGLIPSKDTNSLQFNNYHRKLNYEGRVAYNGNTSFFLEPLEATSITTIIRNNIFAIDVINNEYDNFIANTKYSANLKGIMYMLMVHYLAGSKFNTKFWTEAQLKAKNFFKKNYDPEFYTMYLLSKEYQSKNQILDIAGIHSGGDIGTWHIESWNYNLKGLNVYNKLDKLLKF